MANKIIDLSGSPAPPTRSPTVITLRSLCDTGTQSRRAIKASCLNRYPNGCCINQYCVASWIHKRLAALNSSLSPIPMSTPHAAKYVPVTDQLASASLYPRGSNLNQARILEHELFVMGMIKRRRRRLSKIGRNVMWNRSTPQIQSYTKSFFGHRSSTNTYGCKSMDQNQIHATAISGNETLNLFPNPMMPKPQPVTLPLFPEEAIFCSVAPREVGNNGNACDEGDLNLDLELKLG
ncbi:hypothetical protein VNO77_19853 [Canavalia gladiata]|uniref:Uncharacterized protein n=1 Tax=Canavalia gladiata TaxID=3824 RepID=A0AAN9QKS8_CANGL